MQIGYSFYHRFTACALNELENDIDLIAEEDNFHAMPKTNLEFGIQKMYS